MDSSYAELHGFGSTSTARNVYSTWHRFLPNRVHHRPSGVKVKAVLDETWVEVAPAPAPAATLGEDSLEQAKRLKAAQRQTMELDAAFLDDYGTQLQRSSRAAFECFMQYNPLSEPMLGAEPTGILEATWARGDEVLTLRFNDRHRLAYAVSYRTPTGERRRDWGESTLSTFFSDCPEGKRIASL